MPEPALLMEWADGPFSKDETKGATDSAALPPSFLEFLGRTATGRRSATWPTEARRNEAQPTRKRRE